MKFEKSNRVEIIGEAIGFIMMYLIFSIILFFLLRYLGKLPSAFNFLYFLTITALVVLIGSSLKRYLHE